MRALGTGTHSARSAALGLAAAFAAAVGVPATGLPQEVGEIVVTARRVEEKLKDVPLAVTAFDTSTIEAAGITNLLDVASLTPGLSFFNALGENLPVPIIRGVVPQDIFGVNAAAIFVDGVYVSGREGLNFSQLDLERIEVLKGPQSAMYGRNAFSGAINYITRAPSDVFESKAEVEGGNRGKQKILGQISGPIFTDTFTGRFSAMYDEWDGSYDNSLAPESDIGGYRFRSLQGRLRWRPQDALEVNFGLYYSNDEIDEAAVGGLLTNCEDRVEQTTANATGRPFTRYQNWCGKVPDLRDLPDMLDGSQFPDIVPIPNSVTRDRMPKNPRATGEDRDLLRGHLNIAWDLDFGTFSFLTGYSDTEQQFVQDFERLSGLSIPLMYCPDASTIGVPQCLPPYSWVRAPMGFIDYENGSTVEEWSQEVRFTSPQDQRLRYSVGLYVYDVDLKEYPGDLVATTELPASIFDIGIGPVAYPTALAIGSYIFGPSLTPDGGIDPLNRMELRERTDAWSVFGSMDFDLTDAWQARVELRYSQEHQENYSFSYKRCAQPNPDNDPSYSEFEVDKFPFNSPPVEDCGDDFVDLRVIEPCIEIPVDDPTILDQQGNYVDTNGDGIIQPFADGSCNPGASKGSARFSTVTGRIGLKYKFESGWMAYGSVARGEKPGGLQLLRGNVITSGGGVLQELIVNPFDPEVITAYELGLKGYTADRRIGLDLALFYNDWTDVVLRQLVEVAPSGLPFEQPVALNTNAGDARVWGWEASADIGFTDNLTGRLTAGYTDSKLQNARMDTFATFPSFYTDEPSCAPSAIQAIPDPTPGTTVNEDQDRKAGECRAISGDVSGNTQMRQPEWTASASLTYRRALVGDWDWFARADGNYLGKIFIGNDNQGWLPSRTNLNLRIGFDSPRYSVEFWVRNLLDNDNPIAAYRDIYWTNDADIHAVETPTTIRDASNFDDFPPLRMSVTYPSLRTFGVVAKMRFGASAQ